MPTTCAMRPSPESRLNQFGVAAPEGATILPDGTFVLAEASVPAPVLEARIHAQVPVSPSTTTMHLLELETVCRGMIDIR